MNIVKTKTEIVVGNKTLAGVLGAKETAFVGKCGFGPEHSLYLIVYDRVVLAEHPSTTWSDGDCEVYVERYVNVEIKEVSK